MPHVIALCGLSGAGKTHLRTTDPCLKDLSCVDIADIYEEHHRNGLQPQQALWQMLDAIRDRLDNGIDVIVAEAYFKRGGRQREWLENYAGAYGWTVEYIELDTPIEVCIERVQRDAEEFQKRTDISREVKERFERYSEARRKFLEGVAARCE